MASKGEESRVQSELVNAAVAHNAVFSSCIALNRSNAAHWQQSSLDAADLSSTLEVLHQLTADLVQEGQSWRQARSIASAAVSNHQKMVEILEIPQTLDVCLRAEMFHEALLILDYAQNLLSERRNRKELHLLDQLEANIGRTLRIALQMVVLPRLSQALPLNTAVKLVSFLRRLHTPDEVLTSLFLDCKTTFLDQCLQDAATMSHTPYAFLSKLLNAFKVQVSEAVNQFKACFPAVALAHLAKWSSGRAASLLSTFEQKLQLVTNGAEIASLMDQTTNACSSCVRVGIDIGPMLMTRLCLRAIQLFAAQIQGAAAAFRAAMQSISWKLPAGNAYNPPKASEEGATTSPPPAPIALLPYLPLAYAMNGILSAFNEIRRCAAKAIVWPCLEELGKFLRIMLAEVRRVHLTSQLMETHEQESLRRFRVAFTEAFFPHVWLCAQRVFAGEVLLVSELECALEDEVKALSERPFRPSGTEASTHSDETQPEEMIGSL
jgi:conserved oligomeric Golgi complex subunit 8